MTREWGAGWSLPFCYHYGMSKQIAVRLPDNLVGFVDEIVDSGATMIALLALSDSGAPSYDASHAAALADIGIPAFACTPDLFPDLMAAAIDHHDLSQWAATNDIVTAHQVQKD